MELDGLIQYIKMSRNKSVIVDQCIPEEYPGYVRTITIMQNSIVRVEFEVYGCDEGGITYFVQYFDYECLVKNLEEYLAKKIEDWDNINQSGFYPKEITVNNIDTIHKKIKTDLINKRISLPFGGIKIWMPDGYWKRLTDKPNKIQDGNHGGAS